MRRELTGTWQTANSGVSRLLQDKYHQTDALLARIDSKAYPTSVEILARHAGSLTSLALLLIEEHQALNVLVFCTLCETCRATSLAWSAKKSV